eukprot:s761_g17.t1
MIIDVLFLLCCCPCLGRWITTPGTALELRLEIRSRRKVQARRCAARLMFHHLVALAPLVAYHDAKCSKSQA